ncbi:hypothetical protein GQX73_g10375 [Xylaria multiplex]|uniref:Spherulation-specific family 4 n=1 Tax=Xylaria multiplex TaxID=323545 RepID=A0A7C8MQR3_9PEZI|nr:hypothetical protein GQX73_g10375 [Xylaria multiplex]
MALIRAVSALLATGLAVSATGVLLPLYVYPSAEYGDGAANWQPALAAIAASPNTPWLAVVNPANGPGATGEPGNGDANYVSGVSQLNAHDNVQTIGYVRTDYGAAPAEELHANITTWASWTAGDVGVSGIFFDEASAADFDYLSAAITFARTAFGARQIVAACNFGAAVGAEFYDICDVVVVFESYLNNPEYPAYEGADTLDANTPDFSYRPQAAVIVHDFVGSAADGQSADTALLRKYVQEAKEDELGWVYFCSAGYETITAAPATAGALAAVF